MKVLRTVKDVLNFEGISPGRYYYFKKFLLDYCFTGLEKFNNTVELECITNMNVRLQFHITPSDPLTENTEYRYMKLLNSQ